MSSATSRRGLLRGAFGVALALPLLESLGTARAGGTPPLRRFVAFIEPNGVNIDRFWPALPFGLLTPDHFAQDRALHPLRPHLADITIPRGLRGVPDEAGLPGNSHMRGIGRLLTAAPLLSTSKYAAGISVDQRVALFHGEGPALNVFVGERTNNVMDHCSYLGADLPAPPENDPYALYLDLVGLSGLDEEALARVLARRESVLDLVSDEYERLLQQDLSQADRQKLEMHFNHVRDLETNLEEEGFVPCGLPEETLAELEALDPDTIEQDGNFAVVGNLLLDVVAMSLACGRTRVATIQWGAASGGPIYEFLSPEHDHDHHFLSHGTTTMDEGGEEIAGYRDRLFEIDRFLAERFAGLLDRLSAYEEGEGTLLDHTLVAWMNELSDGRTHDHHDLPVVLAGACGGSVVTGRYLDVREDGDEIPHNKLLTTFLRAMEVTDEDGAPIEGFGADGLEGGVVPQLLA